MKTSITPWYFLLPALLLFTAFVLIPVFQGLMLSFYEWDGIGETRWIGLGNYQELLEDEQFWTSLVNNCLWVIAHLLAPLLGLIFALLLNQDLWGMKFFKSLFFFPFVISQTVVGLVFSWFYDPNFGLLKNILSFFSLPSIAILADESWVTFGIIIASLWPQTAYCMIIFLTGLTSLDKNQVEAARLDGIKGWNLFWHIIFPQLRPATFLALIVTTIGALRSFDLIATMTDGGPYGQSSVLAYYTYEQSLFNYRMGYGASVASILFIITALYVVLFLRFLLKKER